MRQHHVSIHGTRSIISFTTLITNGLIFIRVDLSYVCPEALSIWIHFVAFNTQTLFILMKILYMSEQSTISEKFLTTFCAQVFFF